CIAKKDGGLFLIFAPEEKLLFKLAFKQGFLAFHILMICFHFLIRHIYQVDIRLVTNNCFGHASIIWIWPTVWLEIQNHAEAPSFKPFVVSR
ncbi:hypothetical protein ACJX0J_022157, partial [Zea mays]